MRKAERTVSLKPRPNDRTDMPTQHVTTLLSPTCCVCLATVLRHVGCCSGSSLKMVKFEPTTPNKSQHVATRWPNARNMLRATMLRHVALACCDRLAGATLVKLEPTCRNTSQQGGPTHATCCTQQCCDMLCWHVAIVWPGLKQGHHQPPAEIHGQVTKHATAFFAAVNHTCNHDNK